MGVLQPKGFSAVPNLSGGTPSIQGEAPKRNDAGNALDDVSRALTVGAQVYDRIERKKTDYENTQAKILAQSKYNDTVVKLQQLELDHDKETQGEKAVGSFGRYTDKSRKIIEEARGGLSGRALEVFDANIGSRQEQAGANAAGLEAKRFGEHAQKVNAATQSVIYNDAVLAGSKGELGAIDKGIAGMDDAILAQAETEGWSFEQTKLRQATARASLVSGALGQAEANNDLTTFDRILESHGMLLDQKTTEAATKKREDLSKRLEKEQEADRVSGAIASGVNAVVSSGVPQSDVIKNLTEADDLTEEQKKNIIAGIDYQVGAYQTAQARDRSKKTAMFSDEVRTALAKNDAEAIVALTAKVATESDPIAATDMKAELTTRMASVFDANAAKVLKAKDEVSAISLPVVKEAIMKGSANTRDEVNALAEKYDLNMADRAKALEFYHSKGTAEYERAEKVSKQVTALLKEKGIKNLDMVISEVNAALDDEEAFPQTMPLDERVRRATIASVVKVSNDQGDMTLLQANSLGVMLESDVKVPSSDKIAIQGKLKLMLGRKPTDHEVDTYYSVKVVGLMPKKSEVQKSIDASKLEAYAKDFLTRFDTKKK